MSDSGEETEAVPSSPEIDDEDEELYEDFVARLRLEEKEEKKREKKRRKKKAQRERKRALQAANNDNGIGGSGDQDQPQPGTSASAYQQQASTSTSTGERQREEVSPAVPDLKTVGGLSRGFQPEKILGATEIGDERVFLIRWKETGETDLVLSKDARHACPQLVIDFYEERLVWKDRPTESGNDSE